MTDTINDVMAGAFSDERPCGTGCGRWGRGVCDACKRPYCDECLDHEGEGVNHGCTGSWEEEPMANGEGTAAIGKGNA